MKFIPHDYQKTAIQYILDHPYCGLFLDMGLGKTVSALTAVDILINDRLEVKSVLIVAPKRVAVDTWPQEVQKWDHTKGLTYTMLTGTPTERKAGLTQETDLYITTRDLVPWLVETVGKDWRFDMVIVDELSSFKSSRSKRFRALKKVRPLIKRLVGLTGTPKPNSYMDLWSEIYLLDQGERLGRTITSYRSSCFIETNWGGFPSYTLCQGADELINKKIADICISMKAKDYLPLEDPMIIDRWVTLGPKERKLYKQLERDYLLSFPESDVTAINGAALSNKLLQLANGAVYDENGTAIHVHDAKLDTLKEMVEEGENLLVFYAFRSDKERILKAIPEAVALEGEEQIKAWREGKIKVLLAHPASAGHGLNLQEGGHVVVWFGLNWSLELYAQANARIQRQGQTEPVRIYRILAKDTLDESVAKALDSKARSQEALLEALKVKIRQVVNHG